MILKRQAGLRLLRATNMASCRARKRILRVPTGNTAISRVEPPPQGPVTLSAPSTPAPCVIKSAAPDQRLTRQSYQHMLPHPCSRPDSSKPLRNGLGVPHPFLLTLRGEKSRVCPGPSAKANLTLRGGHIVDPVVFGPHPRPLPQHHPVINQ